MKIAIFGLGYVGVVNAACLAQQGHEVIGVDVNPTKIQMVNRGETPIKEKEVEPILFEQVRKGALHATASPYEAVSETEISMICVGTPSTSQGFLDLGPVTNVCKQIGRSLRSILRPHTVVIRSTVLPGTTERMARILCRASSRLLGKTLHVAFNPEFLREGTAVTDFYSPPYTVVGTTDLIAADIVKGLYGFLDYPCIFLNYAEAEMIKYAANAFHAVKITFANEIGRLARHWNIDGSTVMDLICRDTRSNISPAYLRPGFAFGGSCLPKDIRALVARAHSSNLGVPLLESLNLSNQIQIDAAYDLISSAAQNKTLTIGFLGLAFKDGTDDLRESPMVELVERLLGKGHRLLLYDENVSLNELIGSNKNFIQKEIPHLVDVMTNDIRRVINETQLLVVSRSSALYTKTITEEGRSGGIIDLESALNNGPLASSIKTPTLRRQRLGYDQVRQSA